MINNYNRIVWMADKIGYLDKWVLLRFISRKTENGVKNKILSRKFAKLSQVNMQEVAVFCESHKCRCYLSFFDAILDRLWRMADGSIDFIDSWNKEAKIYDIPDCLHLIDVDNITLEEDHISWLESKGISDIFVLPSKTGHSIVFKGDSSLVKEYEKTGWNDINTIHLNANINLYIPDF